MRVQFDGVHVCATPNTDGYKCCCYLYKHIQTRFDTHCFELWTEEDSVGKI